MAGIISRRDEEKTTEVTQRRSRTVSTEVLQIRQTALTRVHLNRFSLSPAENQYEIQVFPHVLCEMTKYKFMASESSCARCTNAHRNYINLK
jgi:hypothetical protein